MSKWSSFPWCNAPFATGANLLGGRYPVRFSASELLAALDRNTYTFRFDVFRGTTDVRIEIDEASSLLNIGQLAALDIALDPLIASASGRLGMLGTMTRRDDSSKCVATKFVFNQALCYVELNLSDVVREQLGNTTLYRPRMTIIYYGDKCLWTNELQLLVGNAGDVPDGFVEVVGSSGFIDQMYSTPVTQEGNFTGNITPGENIDLLNFTPRSGPAGTDVTLSGITFEPITEVTFGELPAASFSQASSGITARSPANAKADYITMRGGEFKYETRVPFVPA